MASLGNWVRTQPLTVGAIAKGIGVSRVMLHRYMNGSAMPRPGVVAAIETTTGGEVTGADLLRDHKS